MSFGSLSSVRASDFHRLPHAMQGEAVRLMLEHGETLNAVARHLNTSGTEVLWMAARNKPFTRGGDVNGREDHGCAF